jgi:adenylate kinase
LKNLIAITGTPGTGKTSACRILEKNGEKVVYLNELIDEKIICGYDKKRDTKIVDIRKLDKSLDRFRTGSGKIFLEGHEAHLLSVNYVIVLRCSPRVLLKRLKSLGWSEMKIMENVEAEAIDLITIESIERYEKVYEIDTTHRTPAQVADAIICISKNRCRAMYKAGRIDWTEEFLKIV